MQNVIKIKSKTQYILYYITLLQFLLTDYLFHLTAYYFFIYTLYDKIIFKKIFLIKLFKAQFLRNAPRKLFLIHKSKLVKYLKYYRLAKIFKCISSTKLRLIKNVYAI